MFSPDAGESWSPASVDDEAPGADSGNGAAKIAGEAHNTPAMNKATKRIASSHLLSECQKKGGSSTHQLENRSEKED